MDLVLKREQATASPLPFNVRPCLRDPVFGLVKDRWGLSPLAGAGLFLLIYLGGNFFFSWLSGTAFPREGLDIPFLHDSVAWILYGFLLPMGTLLGLRFYTQAESTFERLYTDGVVQASLNEYNQFLERLHRRYNSVGLHLGTLGLAIIVFGYMTYENQRDGKTAWLDLGMGVGAMYHQVFGLIGWYAAQMVLLKAVITARALQGAFQWRVNVQPLHPDGCGGLRLITDVSVTIALFTAVMGLSVVLFMLSNTLLSGKPPSTTPVLIAVALEAITPLIFFTCLYSAHRVMQKDKESLLRQINQQVQPHYETLRGRLTQGEVMNDATEEIMRLDGLHAFARRLPVWPINTQTIAQVFLSVAVPLALLILQLIMEHAVDK